MNRSDYADLEDGHLSDDETVRGDEWSDHIGHEEDEDGRDKEPSSTLKRKLVMSPVVVVVVVGNNEIELLTSLKSTSSQRASEADDEGVKASHCPSKKKRKVKGVGKAVTGVARPPTAGYLKYNMEHYKLYDPTAKNVGGHREDSFNKFGDFDSYTLFMIPTCRTASSVPDKGIRLDDLTVALVGTEGYSNEKLVSAWRAEFDEKGMVRASRVPLGHAAKVFCKEGDVDLDGHILSKGEEGWYYQWYKGLQLLCGQEGLKAGRYLQRPARERRRVKGLGFKRGCKAVVQLEPGHRDDGTFKDLHLPDYAMLPVGDVGETTTTTKAFTVNIDGKWMKSSSSSSSQL